MRIKVFALICSVLLIEVASGLIICIDHDAPTWENASLSLSAKNNDIELSWDTAKDIPNCSGIDYYDVYRSVNSGNFSLISSTSDAGYVDDDVSYGNYEYMIHAFDLAGHNEGGGLLSSIKITKSEGGKGGGTSGGRGGEEGPTIYYTCGKWSRCLNGTQERTCFDANGIFPKKVEIRTCIPEYSPLSSGEKSASEGDKGNELRSENFITGAVAGMAEFAKSKQGMCYLLVLGVIIASLILFKAYRKRKVS